MQALKFMYIAVLIFFILINERKNDSYTIIIMMYSIVIIILWIHRCPQLKCIIHDFVNSSKITHATHSTNSHLICNVNNCAHSK